MVRGDLLTPEENRDPCPVTDTAALVMLWASGYYAAQPLVAAYLRMLDLSLGRDLLECYNRICPWYEEVIINRKHCIRMAVEALVPEDAERVLIANLGSGFSTLALELSPLLGERVRFIEIDVRNMGMKRELYGRLVPDRCRFITGIEADVTDTTRLTDILAGELRDPAHSRLIVVMEGLSTISRDRSWRRFSHPSPVLPRTSRSSLSTSSRAA